MSVYKVPRIMVRLSHPALCGVFLTCAVPEIIEIPSSPEPEGMHIFLFNNLSLPLLTCAFTPAISEIVEIMSSPEPEGLHIFFIICHCLC